MSDLSDVRDGLKTAIEAEVDGWNVYTYAPRGLQVPAIWMNYEENDTVVVFKGNTIEGEILVTAACYSDKEADGWAQLEEVISPTGGQSLIKGIRDNRNLNNKVDDAEVMAIENFRYENIEDMNLVAADVRVSFIKSIA